MSKGLTRYVTVSLDMLDEGRVLANLSEEFTRLQQACAKHAGEFGSAAKGAVGKLSFEMRIKCTACEGGDAVFDITCPLKLILPPKPPVTTTAIGAYDKGKPALFARASGTTSGDPRQLRLATEDGRPINPESGEVIAEEQS